MNDWLVQIGWDRPLPSFSSSVPLPRPIVPPVDATPDLVFPTKYALLRDVDDPETVEISLDAHWEPGDEKVDLVASSASNRIRSRF